MLSFTQLSSLPMFTISNTTPTINIRTKKNSDKRQPHSEKILQLAFTRYKLVIPRKFCIEYNTYSCGDDSILDLWGVWNYFFVVITLWIF